MTCRKIKNLIDQAERPDLLGHEIERHTTACEPCRLFADERFALRSLLSSPGRVGAPSNFDMLLRAKLAEQKGRRSPWLFVPAAYLRLAGVAAVLLVVFVAGRTLLPQDGANQERANQGIASQERPAIVAQTGEQDPVDKQGEMSGSGLGFRKMPAVPVHLSGGARPTSINSVGYRTAARGSVVRQAAYNGDLAEKALLLRNSGVELEIPRVSQGAELSYHSSMLQASAQMDKIFY